jgi:cobalt-zinc-cadmium efflux system membrane fusion protein
MTASSVASNRWASPRVRRALLAGSLAASLVLVVLALAFSRPPPSASGEAPGIQVGSDRVGVEPEAAAWRVLKLGAATAAAPHWSEPVPARVRIDERLAARVGAPLEGRVTRVHVDLGQPVRAGAPLLTISSPDIASLRAERDKAQLALEAARRTLDRVRSMVEAESLPAKEALAAEEAEHEAELTLRSAQAHLSSLRITSTSEHEFVLAAPRDGVVVEKNVLPGQEVSPDSTPLVVLADLSRVWVVADLFEADTAGIVEGTRTRIALPSIPGAPLEARVTMLARVVDPERHTVAVRIDVPNPVGQLRPNVFAQVSFAVEPVPGSAEVASSAVLSNGANDYVYVQEGSGQFVRREVLVGPTRDGKTLLVSGVKPGEVVVEEGAILLDNEIMLAH